MPRGHISEALRDAVRQRAQGRCEYCQTPEVTQVGAFHCDHCLPRSKGGTTNEANLAWSCPHCNGSKLAATQAPDPPTGELTRLFNPRIDRWDEHFRWSEDRLALETLTPTARATAAILGMNRPKLRYIRGLLLELGLHPAG